MLKLREPRSKSTCPRLSSHVFVDGEEDRTLLEALKKTTRTCTGFRLVWLRCPRLQPARRRLLRGSCFSALAAHSPLSAPRTACLSRKRCRSAAFTDAA